MGHGLSPGRGTEKQGGGLKYASVAPETTRVWPRFDLIPIKLSLASRAVCRDPPARALPRPLADPARPTWQYLPPLP